MAEPTPSVPGSSAASTPPPYTPAEGAHAASTTPSATAATPPGAAAAAAASAPTRPAQPHDVDDGGAEGKGMSDRPATAAAAGAASGAAAESKDSIERFALGGFTLNRLSERDEVRLLVDCGSLNNGRGAPQASLQMIPMIRNILGFKGIISIVTTPIPASAPAKEREGLEQDIQDAIKKDLLDGYTTRKQEGVLVPQAIPDCLFGFTGAYDKAESAHDALYDIGLNCQYFITLSTQGWYTLNDGSGHHSMRIGPCVKARKFCSSGDPIPEPPRPEEYADGDHSVPDRWFDTISGSVYLPRKDVLLLSEHDSMHPKKGVIQGVTSCQAVKVGRSATEEHVLIYKLDQGKNLLTPQRAYIIAALKERQRKTPKRIVVTEFITPVLDPKDKAELDRIPEGPDKAALEKIFYAKAKAELEKKVRAEYAPIEVIPLDKVSPEEYHAHLARSNLVFCEGQSTGSQAMLYGTPCFHIPLDAQGVPIHESNLSISHISGRPEFLTPEQRTYTTQMQHYCDMMRFDTHLTSKPPRTAVVSSPHCEQAIEYGLSTDTQKTALALGNSMRLNPRLDMLSDCIGNLCRLEPDPAALMHSRREFTLSGSPASIAKRRDALEACDAHRVATHSRAHAAALARDRRHAQFKAKGAPDGRAGAPAAAAAAATPSDGEPLPSGPPPSAPDLDPAFLAGATAAATRVPMPVVRRAPSKMSEQMALASSRFETRSGHATLPTTPTSAAAGAGVPGTGATSPTPVMLSAEGSATAARGVHPPSATTPPMPPPPAATAAAAAAAVPPHPIPPPHPHMPGAPLRARL